MKIKSDVGGSREENDRIFCQLTKNSKGACFQAKVSQGPLPKTSIEDHQDVAVTFDGEMLVHANGSGDEITSQDSTAGGSSLPPACSATAETISPIIDPNEGNSTVAVGECYEDRNNISSDHRTCSLSDFYIPDMSMADFSLDENTGLGGIFASYLYPEYQFVDCDLISDVAQRNMLLPFLEDDMETRYFQDEEFVVEDPMTLDDSYVCLAFQQMKPSERLADTDCSISELHEDDDFDPHLFIRNLPDLSEVAPSLWPVLLTKESQKKKPITLVLDLDETLVHSSLEYSHAADFTFPVFFNMREHIVYVQKRPHLHMFLERVAKMFEIFVFTASQSIYAEKLCNILDPKGELISRCVYRESCIFSDGNYVKDLTVLGLDLAKVAIVDNSPQVFQLQVNNGIPIESWFDDPSDCALISLLPFLETLVDADDVRPIIEQRFNNKR